VKARIAGPARFRLVKARSTLGLVGNYCPTFARVVVVTLELSPLPGIAPYDPFRPAVSCRHGNPSRGRACRRGRCAKTISSRRRG